jgi:RNA polymerase sigma factor (sigma-70 family)
MSDDHALLIRYARSRDAEAFALLVQRYTALVFSVACRITGNASSAEDITQDCFLTLASQASSIRGSLPAWLHRVALNRSMYISRNEAKRKHHEIRAFSPSKTAGESIWNQITPLVDAALAKLPDELREPLVQHFLLGRSQVQVAENLHIGQATVSRRIQEGIERLREHLKNAGVVCGAAALSSALVENASAAVPARLSASLAKMAMAGPTKIAATTTITAILIAKAKLIAAVAAIIFAGAVLTYRYAPSLHPKTVPQSSSHFSPRPYLSKLVLKGDGYTQDSFSLAFQAAAKVLGREADYETIYGLSTNAFCPGIELTHTEGKSYWHIQARLGDKAIQIISSRYGLVARSLDRPDFVGDEAAYRRTIAPSIIEAMDAGNVILVEGGWQSSDRLSPWAGIIADAQSDGAIYGATLNGRQDNPLIWPVGVWSLAPAAKTITPHEADIATLRWAVARIRGQSPFKAASQSVYGLQAMDVWIKAMSEIPGFCEYCMDGARRGDTWYSKCAHDNASTTRSACIVAARYFRRIAPDFPPNIQSRLQSVAARYDHIAALLAPALAKNGPDSYVNILGDLSKQRTHAAKVLVPVRSEYSAIAQELELALSSLKP